MYVADWHQTDVAVKVFKLPGGAEGTATAFSTALLAKIKVEESLLASIRHPYVVAFLGVCEHPPCVVTELCSKGSLLQVLRQAKEAPAAAAELVWSRRLGLVADAATGMLHLHQRSPPVLHRDMKSLNLLVTSAWRAKVSDLGLGRIVDEVNATASAGSTMAQLNPRWVAPEILEGLATTTACDVYSFGVVLWEVLTWELPWSNINPYAIFAHVMRGDALPLPERAALPGPAPACSGTLDAYIALMQQCTSRDPTKRPGFGEIVQKLKFMAAEELRTTGAASAGGPSSGGGDGDGDGAGSAMCVVCLERPPAAGLVHRSAKM